MTHDTHIHFHVCVSIVKKIKQVDSSKLFITIFTIPTILIVTISMCLLQLNYYLISLN